MATPATTCPQCAQLLAATDSVCPQCGYQFPVPPPPQAAQPQQTITTDTATGTATDTVPTSIPHSQTHPPLPVYGPSSVTHEPPTGPALPVTMSRAIPDQTQKSARHLIARLALAFVLVLAVVTSAAVGAYHYLPALSRFALSPRATATAVPVGAVLFQDPLTSKAHDWTDDQHCSFAPDGYHVRDGYECYAPTASQRDITLSVDARQLSGPTDRRYGLGFRLNAAGDEYLFAIDSNGHWLFGKYIAGAFTIIVQPTASSAIKQGLGSANTLTVRAIGSHFEFAINKTPVGSADDTALQAGYCGVEGSRSVEIVFTHLKIVKAA